MFGPLVLLHWSPYLFCVSTILFYYYGSELNLAIWKGNPSRIILSAYNYFSYLQPSLAPCEFQNSFLNFCEDGYFNWNCIKSFGKMVIFTVLCLPIHEHGMFLHFLMTSSISFIRGFHSRNPLFYWLGLFLDILLSLRLL